VFIAAFRDLSFLGINCWTIFADLTTNRLLSLLLGNVASNIGSKVSLICPKGQTVTIEVMPSVDNGYQLILRSCDLHILIAVRLALLNRLEVSSPIVCLFHVLYCLITNMELDL